jgi:hypothetical protein
MEMAAMGMAAMEMVAMGMAAMVVPSEGAGARGGVGCVGKDVMAEARVADMTRTEGDALGGGDAGSSDHNRTKAELGVCGGALVGPKMALLNY